MPLPSTVYYHRFIGTMGSCHLDTLVISYQLETSEIILLGILFQVSFVPYTIAFHIALALPSDPVTAFLPIIGGRKATNLYWMATDNNKDIYIISDNTQYN